MIDKIIGLLEQSEKLEITDDIKEELNKVWEENKPKPQDSDDLFTQKELNDIVEKRVSRERAVYENELDDLQKKMKDLVDPTKVEEYEEQVEDLNNQLDEVRKNTAKDYELKLLATREGITDQDYFDYLVEKNKIKDRMKAEIDDEGNVNIYAADKEGNLMTEEGNKLGPEVIINEFKEQKPDIFTKKQAKDIGGGGGNPSHSGKITDEKKNENAKSLAQDLGYKKQ